MATSNLCRGEQCPVRNMCKRYSMWKEAVKDGNTWPHCLAKCPEGKWFTRDERYARAVSPRPAGRRKTVTETQKGM